MHCPNCGHPKTKADAHTEKNRCCKTVIYRTRICPGCLEVWVTHEVTCICELRDVPIYGVPVVNTTTYESVVFRVRRGPNGTNTTKEEILPGQLDRYRGNTQKLR